MIEQKIINWANAEIQHRRGRGAIVISSQAKLLPVSVPADRCHKYSPVCKVVVPVILESREETLDEIYFSNIEVARITGKEVIA